MAEQESLRADPRERVRAMGALHSNSGLRDDEAWKLAGFMAIFHPEADLDPIYDENGWEVVGE